jgi:photosystem II stability/assembly factor-like uncharacterized protein
VRKLFYATASAIALTLVPSAHAQWQLQTSNTTADLRGIHNVGNGVAWASGTNGTVLRTEDGGYVWQTCAIPPGAEKLDFRGIQAFDANTAIVMSSGKGDQSRLYKTTDGCHTWNLLFTNPDPDGFWDALLFGGKTMGWVLGDPTIGQFAIFSSADGGKTWFRLKNQGLDARPETQGAFAASNSSITGAYASIKFGSGGKDGAFVYSMAHSVICVDRCSADDVIRDQQRTKWVRIKLPIGNGSESSGIFSLAERQNRDKPKWWKPTIVAGGGDYTKPDDSSATAAFSTDGGGTWHASQTPPHGYRSAVAYDPTTKLWITVGPNGTDVSTDDGKNWRPVHPDPALHEATDADRNWNALSLPYVVGPHGRIGKLDPAALKK